MLTKTDIAQVLTVISAAYPNFKMLDGTPQIYLELLGDLDLDELRAAVLACCSEPGRAFAPSVGEIRGAVMELRRQARGLPSASEAWQEVHHSFFYPAEYSHPIIKQVVDRFGFRNLCQSENEIADRAHFMKAYDQACEEAMRLDVQLPAVTRYVQEHSSNLLRLTDETKALAGRLKA